MLDFSILLPGVPVSSLRGALGWGTVALIKQKDHNILFDTGSYGDRKQLVDSLAEHNLKPDQIDILFVSHLHFDHFLNAELFPQAKIWVSERDLDYVLNREFIDCEDPYVPDVMIRHMKAHLTPYRDGEEIVNGLNAISLPGHTPGTSGLLAKDGRVLFAGDAVKNLWEFDKNISPPAFFSSELAVENYKTIKEIAEIVVPGHDNPFRIKQESCFEYLSGYAAEIKIQTYPREDEKKIKLK
ncbi:MBL fold metallo-hydrolase [uncultured Desulfuromusa sp.]|uniref:MBL fold metallo-hydrolase n=1 Tax=uncultured Desulfuromusa sp. TaxID=219183 RepID=UPI002AA645BA|nr:MBL fold metallo-hydrolase [uncultured Desulfuromusa sp.]